MISKERGIEIYSTKNRPAKILTDLNYFDTTLPSKLRAKSKVAIRKIITRKLGNDVCDFITNHLQGFELNEVLLFDSHNKEEINNRTKKRYRSIVNLSDANDYRRINKFFESVNKKLPEKGIFINSFVPYEQRKKSFFKKFPKPLNHILYLGDFIVHRVFPKLNFTKKLYFSLTRGKGRVLTKTEVFGRLYSCGFDLIKEKMIGDKLYFVAQKTGIPTYDTNPTYGPLISLKRVGKNGKPIDVYKFRTMHPYSEYLQKYVFEKNNLRKGGKIKNDFRISNVGKMFRKYWIDELPMIINLLRGDLKLVGGRPLSNHYFSLYSQELQEKRVKFKPGLIPPFYADMPDTLDDIMKSEMKYLEAYETAPLMTDISYLYKIFKNIIFRGKRSF
ncbi:sugar transferase [Aquimarina sp. 2201CG5-10]|uniref:sugar transferase n=1 Tax=Aquimarina callyspongiae TaxID=3098150 RepID=UPI002AB51DB5|nr:sugar transferase [Aquimarina sp. 2201CG5-10]MDY8136884.1 sugar transferase [Aquimarina sp. 2201CG5-10]